MMARQPITAARLTTEIRIIKAIVIVITEVRQTTIIQTRRIIPETRAIPGITEAARMSLIHRRPMNGMTVNKRGHGNEEIRSRI